MEKNLFVACRTHSINVQKQASNLQNAPNTQFSKSKNMNNTKTRGKQKQETRSIKAKHIQEIKRDKVELE